MRLRPTLQRILRWRALLRRQAQRGILVVLVCVGAACGLATVLFHRTLELTRAVTIDSVLDLPYPWLRAFLIISIPTLVAALLGYLVPRFAPEATGGLGLVRAAYAEHTPRLGVRAWLGTFLATPLSLGSGAPLGPEGPTVVITSGLAVGVARLLSLPQRVVRGMIPVGTAAGIAAIFNTPITGVVFALEEVIGTASRSVLGGALVAAVAAAVVQKTWLGGRYLLPAAPASWANVSEFFGFAFLGLVAGLAAGLVPRAVFWLRPRMRRMARRFGRGAGAARGAVAGLGVGLLGLLAPATLGIGYGEIADWLSGYGDLSSASLAFFAKALAFTLALAAPLVGGVFAPALFLGASCGAAVGFALHALFPLAPIDPGAYALVGMGAFFAGFMRTPIAAVLIVFELTGGYGLVAPQMLTVALAIVVARRICDRTLVEEHLRREGVPEDPHTTDPFFRQRVREHMSAPAVTLRMSITVGEAWAVAKACGHPVLPVVDTDGTLLGIAEAVHIRREAREGRAAEPLSCIVQTPAVTAQAHEILDAVTLRLASSRETRCPVVESTEQPRVVGFLAPSDLLRARANAPRDPSDGPFD